MTDEARKAKEYLQRFDQLQVQARTAGVLIDNTNDMIKAVRWLASEAASYSDTRGRCAEQIRDLKQRRKKQELERAEYQRQAAMIRAEVDAIPDAIERAILYRHYIEDEPLERIAHVIGYSVRQTARIHERALENFYQARQGR